LVVVTVAAVRSARAGFGGASAVADLASAAVRAGAPCIGDPAFVTPRSGVEVAEAIRRCRGCPVVELCGSVAELVHPVAGVWGGRSYGFGARRAD
jgi:Transcription factor WhiB